MNTVKLQDAFDKMCDATYQGHTTHWDPTMSHGINCPACNRATKLRKEAQKVMGGGLE